MRANAAGPLDACDGGRVGELTGSVEAWDDGEDEIEPRYPNYCGSWCNDCLSVEGDFDHSVQFHGNHTKATYYIGGNVVYFWVVLGVTAIVCLVLWWRAR